MRYATEVGAVLKQIGKRAVIIGQSMGAQIAELVAAANPDLVSGLVLVTPVPLGGVNAPVEAVQPFKTSAVSPTRNVRPAGISPTPFRGPMR